MSVSKWVNNRSCRLVGLFDQMFIFPYSLKNYNPFLWIFKWNSLQNKFAARLIGIVAGCDPAKKLPICLNVQVF